MRTRVVLHEYRILLNFQPRIECISSILIGPLYLDDELTYLSLTLYGKQQNFSRTKRLPATLLIIFVHG